MSADFLRVHGASASSRRTGWKRGLLNAAFHSMREGGLCAVFTIRAPRTRKSKSCGAHPARYSTSLLTSARNPRRMGATIRWSCRQTTDGCSMCHAASPMGFRRSRTTRRSSIRCRSFMNLITHAACAGMIRPSAFPGRPPSTASSVRAIRHFPISEVRPSNDRR